MIEAAATCQRNKLKSLSNVTSRLRTVSDGVMLWLRMGVGNKWVILLRCLDVPITMKSVLFTLNLSVLFVTQLEISLRYSPSYVKSVSAVDKDIYTWVSSSYKWWSNLWLWIRELSGLAYSVNNNGPRTEPWGTPENKGTAFEKQFLIFIEWILFIRNGRIQVSAMPDMPYQPERRSRRTE